jgi:hypothetical protein
MGIISWREGGGTHAGSNETSVNGTVAKGKPGGAKRPSKKEEGGGIGMKDEAGDDEGGG